MSQFLNVVTRWDWLWSFIYRQKNLKPHTVVLLFSSRGSPGAAIWRCDYTRRQPSIEVPLVPSSGRMRGSNTILYYHRWSLGYNNTTVWNLTVLHFSKWPRGSQPWIPASKMYCYATGWASSKQLHLSGAFIVSQEQSKNIYTQEDVMIL